MFGERNVFIDIIFTTARSQCSLCLCHSDIYCQCVCVYVRACVQELLAWFDGSFSTLSCVMFSQQCCVGAADGSPALPRGAVFIVAKMYVGLLMMSQLGQAHLLK